MLENKLFIKGNEENDSFTHEELNQMNILQDFSMKSNVHLSL
jgi:hypothetical protein